MTASEIKAAMLTAIVAQCRANGSGWSKEDSEGVIATGLDALGVQSESKAAFCEVVARWALCNASQARQLFEHKDLALLKAGKARAGGDKAAQRFELLALAAQSA
jgi:hypothetical protein